MSDQIFKTAQGAWTHSPAGRRYEMMRSIMPTLVSVEGQMAIVRAKDAMEKGDRDTAIRTGQALPLPPSVQKQLGVANFGGLVELTGSVDTASKLLNSAVALDYHAELAKYRGDAEEAARLNQYRDDLDRASLRMGNWAAKFITPDEMAAAETRFAGDPKSLQAWINEQWTRAGRTIMPPDVVAQFTNAQSVVSDLQKKLWPETEVVTPIDVIRQKAASEQGGKETPPPPPPPVVPPPTPPPGFGAISPALAGEGTYTGDWQKELAEHMKRAFRQAAEGSPY